MSKRVNDLIDIGMYRGGATLYKGVESIIYTNLWRYLLAWHVLSLILLVLCINQEHWVHCQDC